MSEPVYHLAIDIGASSGRHVLGHVEGGRIIIEEMYRFDNNQIRSGGHDCWDVDTLFRNILKGLLACKQAGKVPATVGIDAWGADFVLLDEYGALIGDAVAYGDDRTQGIPEQADTIIKPEHMYRSCGIRRQSFNTLYQMIALMREHPDQIEVAKRFLMIPDYLNYLLTGIAVNEYTNATTTGMLNVRTKDWDTELLEAFDIPAAIFEKPQMPGTVLGGFTEEIQEAVGFNAQVILPATHDTASAVLSVPARGEDVVYISSGTWSLLGVEHEGPITSEAARLQNFSNEGGYDSRFRFLKNIMGLWMVQSIRREYNGVSYMEGARASKHALRREGEREIEYEDLIAAARDAHEFSARVNVNDDRFAVPDSMIDEIRAACSETSQPVPKTPGQVAQCVYRSLALCYADAIADLSALTGSEYTSVNIVGDGCQDDYLNQLTANACRVPVLSGPVESTSLGNLIVQFIVCEEIYDLRAAREAVGRSFDIGVVKPH